MSVTVSFMGGGSGGGESASIIVTGLSETDTVTATKDGKTVQGVWEQRVKPMPVPMAEYLFDGNTDDSMGVYNLTNHGVTFEDDKAVFNGSAYAQASNGVIPVSSDFSVSLWAKVTNSNGTLFSSRTSGNYGYALQESTGVYTYSNKTYQTASTTPLNDGIEHHIVLVNKSATASLYVDGLLVNTFAMPQDASYGQNLVIGAMNTTESRIVGTIDNFTIYDYALSADEVTQIHDGIAYEDCFRIPISEYGTWTVTATDGTRTATQNVLVDFATDFVIPMDYKLWLYREGEEFADVTGGWSATGFSNSGITLSSGTKYEDYVHLKAIGKTSWQILGTQNKMPTSQYSKIGIDVDVKTYYANRSVLCASNSKTNIYGSEHLLAYINPTTTGRQTLYVDISNVTEDLWILMNADGYYALCEVDFYGVWLE